MKNLKQYVNNLQDRIVNKDIKVENGVVYIEDYIKYENQQWWLKVDNVWNALCKVVFQFMKLAKILTMIFLQRNKNNASVGYTNSNHRWFNKYWTFY